MRLANKFIKVLDDIFLRLYPWQINFFCETLKYNPFFSILKFMIEEDIQNGHSIAEYEDRFKSFLDNRGYAFSFGTGRMALYVILEALNISEGDEVILPAFTCEVVVHALLYRRIKLVYADIEPRTFNIDVSDAQRKITPKTKAIIAQHSFGVTCKITELSELAKKHSIFLIEDCALSLGSAYHGKPLGSFGHAAIFSTDRTKVTSTQFGGVAFTHDAEIAKKIEEIYLKSPFLSRSKIANIASQVLFSYFLLSPYAYYWGKNIFKFGYKLSFFFDHVDDKNNFKLPQDYPCRLSNFQSFLGIGQLEHLQDNLRLRKDTVEKYVSILKGNGIELPYEIYEQTTLRFSLLLKERDKFVNKWQKYFEIGKWFDSPVLGWYAHMEKVGYIIGSCPVAEKVHKRIINFPTHQANPRIRKFIFAVLASIQEKDVIFPNSLLGERGN